MGWNSALTELAVWNQVVKLLCNDSRKQWSYCILTGPADGTEDESKIVIEPQPDAVLRLGQFIGDKTYLRDFLSL